MQILGGVLLTMLNDDVLSGRVVLSRDRDFSVPRRKDWCARHGSVVDATVGHDPLVNGMESLGIKAGADMGEMYRIPDKRSPEAPAVWCVVVGVSVAVRVKNGLVVLFHVDELSGNDPTIARFFAIMVFFFEQQRELITLPEIKCERDVPLKDVTELHNYVVRQSCFHAGMKQARCF